MGSDEPFKHHYVPQFYMRQFACVDDNKKIMTLECHRDVVVVDRKSIKGIGYEDRLHNYEVNGVHASIESELNTVIETPFSRSSTWLKISGGQCANLDQNDRLSIYGFARHLQLRNLATLRFIENQQARYQAGELEEELTEGERQYHAWVEANPDAAHEMFRVGAIDSLLPSDADVINVIVCQTPIRLRSSTNPTVTISYPGRKSIFGAMFDSLRTWWLTLDRHWGAFIVAGGPSGFSLNLVTPELTRVVNRQYLTQFLNGDARYMLADDDFVATDLNWTGFMFDQKTTRGSRYRKMPAR